MTENTPEPHVAKPEELTIGQLVTRLKVSHAWSILGIATGLLVAAFTFGFKVSEYRTLGTLRTGNVSVLLRDAYPDARLRLVDVSGESLDVCRTRFTADKSAQFEQQDFRNLTYSFGQFDLIISNISIHHLRAPEKQKLFRKCHGWLTSHGVFSFADQCAGATDDLYVRHIESWKKLSFAAGTTEEEWEMWMRHQTDHDHHDSLGDQMEWLRQAGFSVVDCPWRHLLWSAFQARKCS